MTRKEAIEDIQKNILPVVGGKSLRMAIKALSQPEIIRCGQCKYAEIADQEDSQDGYTCQFHRGSIWFSGSYCSWAERREECTP